MVSLDTLFDIHALFAVSCMVPLWRIFKRSGLSPALALVALVPVAGVWIALGILASMNWSDGPSTDPGSRGMD